MPGEFHEATSRRRLQFKEPTYLYLYAAGSDTNWDISFCRSSRFQSTLPRRERPVGLVNPRGIETFQSTLPRRERRQTQGAVKSSLCFNPRSHAGSDVGSKIIKQQAHVSIHAPTQGATVDLVNQVSLDIVSIHAPTQGATALRCGPSSPPPTFQSTLPRRERQLNLHSFGFQYIRSGGSRMMLFFTISPSSNIYS